MDETNASVEIIKEISSEIMVDALIAKAIAMALIDYPILSTTIIKPVFIVTARFIAKYFYKVIKLENDLFFIGVKVEKQLKDYKEKFNGLDKAIKEGKSDEEIKIERDKVKEHLRHLINFTTH